MRCLLCTALVLGWSGELRAHAAPCRQGTPTPPIAIREGRSFRVLCHYGDAGAASLALSVAEATWKPTVRAYGVDPSSRGDERIRLHLYGDRPAFDKACIALEGRTWPGHAGLTSTRYGIAVVLVGEGLNPDLLYGLGPRESDLWTIAHESVHLIGQRVSDTYLQHPNWVREGIAEAVAQQVMITRAGRAGAPPIAQTRDAVAIATVYATMRSAGSSVLDQLLNGPPPGRGVFEQYAIQRSFVQFLREPEQTAAFERALRTPTPEPDQAGAFMRVLARNLDIEKLRDLDTAFEQYLAGLRPRWSLGPGHLEREGRRSWLQIGLERERAWAWKLDQRPPGPWELQLRLRQDPLGQGASAWIALQRRSTRNGPMEWSETIVALELPPGGRPRLMELQRVLGQQGQGAIRVLAEATTSATIDSELDLHRVKIVWEDGEVALELDDHEALRAPLAGEGLVDEWGLGVDPGGVVRWEVD